MTSTVTIYHIPSSEIRAKEFLPSSNCCINLIDTPGFGDTRGVEWDEKIKKLIAGLLNKIPKLDFVNIVYKGSSNRLDLQTKFVF